MEKKVEFTMVKTKERYLCGNFWFNESLLNEDFERLMKRFYDNGIECMGIRHDRGKNVSTHYHIVTFPFVPKAEFEIITDIKGFCFGRGRGTVADMAAYLLNRGCFYETTAAEKYNLKDLKTNINLKRYENEFLKHGINLS